MENPSGADWQNKLLTPDELTAFLDTLSTDDAMMVLQRQLELQKTQPPVTAAPETQVSIDPAPQKREPTPYSPSEPAFLNPDLPLFEARPVTPVPPAPQTGPVERPAEPQPTTTPAAESAATTTSGEEPAAAVPSFSFPWDNTGSVTKVDAEPRAPEPETPASESKSSIWDETGSNPTAPEVSAVEASAEVPTPIRPLITPSEPEPQPEPEPEPEPEPLAPAFAEPKTNSTGIPEIASAEDLVTEYEEDHRVAPEPNFVDEVILGVGGISDDLPAAEPSVEAVATPESDEPLGSKRRPASSLLATWNGSGALLGLGVIGYLAASAGTDLITLAIAGFTALAMAGIGFSLAALAARRASSPQQILSRAAFGVYGNLAPSLFVILARLLATAVATLVAAIALLTLIPQLPEKLSLPLGANGFTFSTGYVVVLSLLALGAGISAVAGKARFILNIVFASVSVAASAGALVLAILEQPARFVLGSKTDFVAALGIASLIVVVLGLLWGTAAVDENLELRRGTMGAKLLTAGIFNWLFIGGLALVAGYAVAGLKPNAIVQYALTGIVAVLFTAMLAHLVARNAAALAGLGLRRINLGSHLMVLLVLTVLSVGLMYRLGVAGIWFNLIGYLPVLGVPVLAWLAIFGVDTLLRRVDYHEVSLVRSYGFYGKVNWFNLIGWLLATAAGWGFLRSNLPEFGWLGYIATPLNLNTALLDAQLGVWIALLLGALIPLIFTIPRIRHQEDETIAMESRRSDLVDVLEDIQ